MTEDVVEVVVGQQNMAHLAAGERHHVRGDRAGLGQSRSGVNEQDLTPVVDQPDRDVAERQPAAEHVTRQLLPVEIQRSSDHCWLRLTSRHGVRVLNSAGLPREHLGNTAPMLIRRVARPMLSAVFISRGVEALRSPKPATDATRQTLEGLSQLPDPVGTTIPSNAETVARVSAAVQIGGGLLLATGKLPRLASAALAVSVVPASLGGHAFWEETEPARRAEQRREFVTDISLLGGLIIAAVDTEGKPSLGWRGRRAARKMSDAAASTLPGRVAGDSLADSALAEKVSHGLQVGAEHGSRLANVARERGGEIAEAVSTVSRI